MGDMKHSEDCWLTHWESKNIGKGISYEKYRKLINRMHSRRSVMCYTLSTAQWCAPNQLGWLASINYLFLEKLRWCTFHVISCTEFITYALKMNITQVSFEILKEYK